MPKRTMHESEVERLEALDRLAQMWAEEDAQAEAEAKRADKSWLSENSGGHMSQSERLDHPEHG